MKRNRSKETQLSEVLEALREFWPLLVLVARIVLEVILLVRIIMNNIENT